VMDHAYTPTSPIHPEFIKEARHRKSAGTGSFNRRFRIHHPP
jgi:hypothetical protein